MRGISTKIISMKNRRMEDNEEIPRAHFENIDIKETVVKIELNLTGLDDNKKE